MNILFVTNTNVPHLGGKSSHILDLKDGLIATGHNAEIISACSIPINMKRYEKIRKAMILPMKLFNPWAYSRKSIDITDRSIQKLVKLYVRDHNVDLIAAQDPISAIKSYEAVNGSIPVTLTMHSYFGKSMSDISADRKAVRHFERIKVRDKGSIDLVKAIIGVDTRIKEDCETIAATMRPSLKVYAIPNFVNTDRYYPVSEAKKKDARDYFGIPDNTKVAICIRRLCEKNGVIFAVKAMENALNTVLLVGGDGPDMGIIQEYIKGHNLQDRVKLLGGVDGELKEKVYNAGDYAIVPSITVNGLQEATSISAIEAMACGQVLIASNIGGLKELVKNNQNGILVEEQAPEQIAEAINNLNVNPALCTELSANGRQSVLENYSHIAGANKYMKVFSDVIN